MRLRIPATLVVTLLSVTSCGDDDGGPPADAAAHVFCAMDPADAGPPPAPDANPCGQLVVSPDDCPEGCIPFA